MMYQNKLNRKLNYLADSFNKISSDWQLFLEDNCCDQLSFVDGKLTELSKVETIYPPSEQTLRVLEKPCNFYKVVIIGQDPYHGENEANGLAFAVNSGIKTPPSLRNIFKELVNEFNPVFANYDGTLLNKWESQGIMLINATLTVIKDQANSLSHIGWQEITDKIIKQISTNNQNCVFILWGNFARNKKTLIDKNKHLVLEGVHPSPLSASRGFFGCDHFKLTNEYLIKTSQTPINWLSTE
ncbi:MAG: uracil-DNA glycosylase [Burkholderiales bacterium]|nr:uracil-DNA glycosylase [Burkholderiales bacterium]